MLEGASGSYLFQPPVQNRDGTHTRPGFQGLFVFTATELSSSASYHETNTTWIDLFVFFLESWKLQHMRTAIYAWAAGLNLAGFVCVYAHVCV